MSAKIIEEHSGSEFNENGNESWISKNLSNVGFDFTASIVNDLLKIYEINNEFSKIITVGFDTKNELITTFEVSEQDLFIKITDKIIGMKNDKDSYSRSSLIIAGSYIEFFKNYLNTKTFEIVDATQIINKFKMRSGISKYSSNKNNIDIEEYEGHVATTAKSVMLPKYSCDRSVIDSCMIDIFKCFTDKIIFTFIINTEYVDRCKYNLGFDSIIRIPLDMIPQFTPCALKAVYEVKQIIEDRRFTALSADKIYDCA